MNIKWAVMWRIYKNVFSNCQLKKKILTDNYAKYRNLIRSTFEIKIDFFVICIENDLIWLLLNKQANSWNSICGHYSVLSLEELD